MRLPGLACAVVALACGDIKTIGGGGDGGTGDGGTPDARAVGSVSVTIGKLFGAMQPLGGNQVIFVDTSGEIVADVATNDSGQATADGIEAGSTMIILIAAPPAGAPAGSQALVVVGVEPGDDIGIAGESDGAAVGDMNIQWGGNGASQYYISNGCTSTSTNDLITTLTFDDECLTDGEAQALARSVDGADVTTGWLGGTVAFASGGTLDLGGTWSAPGQLSVNLSNLPSEAQSVYPRLIPARGNVQFAGPALPQVLLEEASASIEILTPRSFVTSNQVRLEFQPNQPGIGGNMLSMRVAADATSLEVAVADELLPWYGFPVLDAAARTLSWTRSSGAEPDAQFLLMFWTEKAGDERLTVIMAPPGVTEVTMPELPSEFEPFMPANPGEVGIQVQAGETSELDGYRAARQLGFELVFNEPRLGLEAPSTLRRSFGGDDF